jgi:hypothetical protein
MTGRARIAFGAAAVAASLVLGTAGSAVASASTPNRATAEAARSPAATANYTIIVRTSDVPFAGTDGYVEVRLHGARGTSRFVDLDNARNNFERGKTDVFPLTLPDVGRLSSIDVRFRPAGVGPDWRLDWIKIGSALFPAYRWFTKAETVNLRRA